MKRLGTVDSESTAFIIGDDNELVGVSANWPGTKGGCTSTRSCEGICENAK